MKSKATPIFISVLIPLLSVVVALALIYFKKSSLGAEDMFPYSQYMASPESLSGNSYRLNAQLNRQMALIPASGRVVLVSDSKGTSQLAILVPNKLEENLSTGQRYKFYVDVESGGKIIVRSMEKF